ncbi:hypothetical protein SPRG_11688 [Saprolegnia parasitica CBS 223.65]|uniref:Major facilitator superfamily (MFS) profile domain-containing protein n=1 Tax=Saprolegnia parasitica (strain CBS 223.65) TaxID=695850 RepID=A0A067BVD6_SAPPC|nr:hypothetical protein SPRG_11688 [Saprolegnia parasitica CBS 223.65]KDO22504.1 hypothetical protein SPRG_11688 [Saprolegnia parasitica CBS 223.65]|eukprot:XP_012206752.1 hypothetical protein SPRG_11688 [Saprolegnia parasitica CBS 223.65]
MATPKSVEADVAGTGFEPTSPLASTYDETSELNPTGCSLRFMTLLSLPRMAIAMAWSAQTAVYGPLLQILLSSTSVQLVQMAGPISGVLLGPTVGVWSDTCTSRFGRRRPFLALGATASILCWVLLMYIMPIGRALGDTDIDRPWTSFLAVLCYVWIDITLNVAQVPLNLILADFAGDRQVTAQVVGGLITAVGYLIVAAYTYLFGPAYNSLQSFLSVLISVMFVSSSFVCLCVYEQPLPTTSTPVPTPSATTAVLGAVYTGLRDLPPPLRVYFAIAFLTQYGYTAYNSSKGQFFGLVVNGGDAAGADMCGSACSPAQDAYNRGVQLAGSADALYLVGLAYLLFLPRLVRRFGAKRVVAYGCVPQVLLLLLAFCKETAIDLAIVGLVSVTQCTIMALAMPLVVHVLGPDADAGRFAGSLNSALCFGQLLNYVCASVAVTTAWGYTLPIFLGGLCSVAAWLVAIAFFNVEMHSM